MFAAFYDVINVGPFGLRNFFSLNFFLLSLTWSRKKNLRFIVNRFSLNTNSSSKSLIFIDLIIYDMEYTFFSVVSINDSQLIIISPMWMVTNFTKIIPFFINSLPFQFELEKYEK